MVHHDPARDVVAYMSPGVMHVAALLTSDAWQRKGSGRLLKGGAQIVLIRQL
jgi:hypothetical protein